MEKVFKIFLLVILYVYGAVRMPYMKNRDKIKYVKNKNTKLEKMNVFIAWLGMCLVPHLYAFTNIFEKYAMKVPFWGRSLAAILMILDVVYFYYIHKELSNNWSPILEIRENQKLITSGVYKYVRHPMYTQCWAWVFLQGIVSSNAFVWIFGLLSWGFLYFTRVFNEEKLMLEEFGDEYKEYMNKTGRILPKIF